jgi:uncharacterized protein (TIGR02118 family)
MPASKRTQSISVWKETAMLKLVLLLRRHEDLSAEQFQSYWREHHIPLVVQLPGLRSLVLNVPQQSSGATATTTWDGIAEDWFDSPQSMADAMISPAGQAVAADAPNFLDMTQCQMLVVEEHTVLPAGNGSPTTATNRRE